MKKSIVYAAVILTTVASTGCGRLPYYRESGTGLKRFYEDDKPNDPKIYEVRSGNGTFNRYRYHY